MVQTEMGWLEVPPKHIMVIPRGVVFRVEVSESSRGYVLEIFKVRSSAEKNCDEIGNALIPVL